jgi:hypothetical protein
MVAVFTSQGLVRVDGYESSRSGNKREGDHNKSKDFSHAYISSRAIARYHSRLGRWSRSSFPIGLDSIIVVDATIVLPVPIPILAPAVLRRLIQLIFCQIHTVATETGVVF